MSIRDYDGKDVRIRFEPRRCIHAAECVNRLPKVFDPQAKPWIQPDGASLEGVARVVARCPTGALHAESLDGTPLESPDTRGSVTIRPDGPLHVRGDITIDDGSGEAIAKDSRIALCRCGASKNKPFCDNSHVEAKFEDTGNVESSLEVANVEDGPLGATVFADGPVILVGAHVIVDGTGHEHPAQKRSALCRCGASANKPFCDGSHKAAGFEG